MTVDDTIQKHGVMTRKDMLSEVDRRVDVWKEWCNQHMEEDNPLGYPSCTVEARLMDGTAIAI